MKFSAIAIKEKNYKDIIFDLIALAFVSFVPALSHLTSVPLYYLEPMRLILLASLVYTSKKNVFLLALLLPIFSLLISAHPVFIKTLLITSELSLNIFLFFYFSKLFKNNYASMFSSILLSKFFYYTLKFGILKAGLLNGELLSTPIIFQLIVTVLATIYVGWFFKREIRL